VKQNTHLHLTSRLRMCGAIPFFLPYILMVCCIIMHRDVFKKLFIELLVGRLKLTGNRMRPVELHTSILLFLFFIPVAPTWSIGHR
jgi:hypothetical protein